MSEPNVPLGWREVKLGDICTFAYGKSLPAKERSGDGFPVYGSNGPVGFHKQAITTGPTIVIGRKGSFGEVHYSSEPCSPIDTTYYITSQETDAHLPWLARRLRCLGLTDLNRAAAVPGLNREDAYRVRLLLPPLPQQKRIAAILDAADALRAKRRESLELLDKLVQSVFLDMFGDPVTNPKGWESGPIERWFDVARGGSPRPISDYITDSAAGVNWIMIGDAEEGSRYISKTAKKIKREGISRSRKVFEGDFLLTNSMSFGRPYILKTSGCIHDGWLVLSPRGSRVHPEYFYSLLSTGALYREFAKRAAGAVVKNLNTQLVRTVSIPVPPIEVQEDFAKIVASVESQKERISNHLAELDALFASLQSRAFRGEL